VRTHPTTRRRDLLRLVVLLLGTRLRGGDLGEAATAWLRELTDRYKSPNILIDLIFQRVLFVSGSQLSAHVLSAAPSSHGFGAGTMKRKAMSFLAPHALSIVHDNEWRALRRYNEAVLQTGRQHPHLPSILAEVEKAFGQAVRDVEEIRRRMGQVMLAVVFGEGNAPTHLVDDIQELFAEVRLKTALFGSRKRALYERFHGELRRLWQSGAGGAQPTLLALAHQAAEAVESPYDSEDVLLDQIPQWMFTFTNSGSDLFVRSLAMIIAREESLAWVRREIAAARVVSEPEAIHPLRYLEACILETGRLFPPVAQTVHLAARENSFEGVQIPAGTEMLQYFPFNNRDTSTDPLANHFRPERWLDPDDSAHRRYPNLFLSGTRACPGRNLIMFVVKTAIAKLLSRGVTARRNTLSDDPLPFSFPPLTFRIE
jgi:cytochrome P450